VHRAGGRVEVCLVHRWASSLSSFYSEFFVESGSLRAASPGSPGTWYLLHLWKNAPRCSLLTAKTNFYKRECGYSIAVEVTCHFPGLFYWAGLNSSSWRAPQEAPWLAVLCLWPRCNSPWPLLTWVRVSSSPSSSSSSFPVDPDLRVAIQSTVLTLVFPIAKVTFWIPNQKTQDTSSIIRNNERNII